MSEPSPTILQDFAHSLQELTFSSLPIIENLTTIAAENPHVADGIIDLISSRIYKCIPEHKLSALHLLDSICKHVSNPYNILVGDDLYDIFSHAFLLVSEPVRTKMVELFETWKTTKAKNSSFPLFPRDQLDKIDSFLSKAGYPKHKGDLLTSKLLIENINAMLPLFKSKLDSAPSSKLQDQYNALLQLKTHLSTQPLKPAQLQAIHARLKAVWEQELGTGAGPSSTSSSNAPSTLKPSAATVQKAESLFRILVTSGLVAVEQAPIPGSKPTYSCVFPSVKYMPLDAHSSNASMLQELLHAAEQGGREYDRFKLSEMVLVLKQTSSSLQSFLVDLRVSSEAYLLLYGAKGWKCGQCGKRFATDSDGSRLKRLHLDWHFRINKKLDDPASRVQSRAWYMDDFDWVAFKDENLLEFLTSLAAHTLDAYQSDPGASKAALSFVQVPPSDTNRNNRCVICREHIKAAFSDEMGEWCWYGCVLAPGEGPGSRKIVHVTCLDETSNKRGAEPDLREVKRERIGV